eukprot:GFYU01006897.1.p1 GENE.GFYU01006897.1~~GFYU01006897.1.p1  ORF type:complete len:106 (-),score=33.39 GFYU01006897.1:210-527(-)
MSGYGKHTIVLIQYTPNRTTRTYHDYETVADAMNGICQLYEQKLKNMNPNYRNITYDISDLFTYIDQLSDLSCLVFNPQVNSYVPYSKEWIKTRIYTHLKKQANP